MPPNGLNKIQMFSLIEGISGWLTTAQAERLWDCVSQLNGATSTVVEVGSFHGRSTVVLATALGSRGKVVAVDPFLGSDRGPQEIDPNKPLGNDDYRQFHNNLKQARVSQTVKHIRKRSVDALADVQEPIDLLFIDGAHRYKPARDDIALWGKKVPPNGTLLIHDAFSSIGVTLALIKLLFFGKSFRYLGRTGSLAEYRREQLSGTDRVVNCLHQLSQLPWFVRNLLVKVALVTKFKPLARLLGHRSQEWPY